MESLGRGLKEIQDILNSEYKADIKDVSEKFVNPNGNHDKLGNGQNTNGNHDKCCNFEGINFIEEVLDEINAVRESTNIKVAADPGSCRNVIHPNALPSAVKIKPPNDGGELFRGWRRKHSALRDVRDDAHRPRRDAGRLRMGRCQRHPPATLHQPDMRPGGGPSRQAGRPLQQPLRRSCAARDRRLHHEAREGCCQVRPRGQPVLS